MERVVKHIKVLTPQGERLCVVRNAERIRRLRGLGSQVILRLNFCNF